MGIEMDLNNVFYFYQISITRYCDFEMHMVYFSIFKIFIAEYWSYVIKHDLPTFSKSVGLFPIFKVIDVTSVHNPAYVS